MFDLPSVAFPISKGRSSPLDRVRPSSFLFSIFESHLDSHCLAETHARTEVPRTTMVLLRPSQYGRVVSEVLGSNMLQRTQDAEKWQQEVARPSLTPAAPFLHASMPVRLCASQVPADCSRNPASYHGLASSRAASARCRETITPEASESFPNGRDTSQSVSQSGTPVRTHFLVTFSKQRTGMLSARCTSALPVASLAGLYSSSHQSLITSHCFRLPATPPRVESRLTHRKHTTEVRSTRNSRERVESLS